MWGYREVTRPKAKAKEQSLRAKPKILFDGTSNGRIIGFDPRTKRRTESSKITRCGLKCINQRTLPFSSAIFFFGFYNIYFVFTNNTKISASRIYVLAIN